MIDFFRSILRRSPKLALLLVIWGPFYKLVDFLGNAEWFGSKAEAYGPWFTEHLAQVVGSPALQGIALTSGMVWMAWTARPGGNSNQVQSPNAESSASTDWILPIVTTDKRDISSRLLLFDPVWDPSGLSTTEPFMDFIFSVFNGSVFAISLTGELFGHIYWERMRLGIPPELEKPDLIDGADWIEHGGESWIRIRQAVTTETAGELRRQRHPIVFYFNEVKVCLKIADNDIQPPPTLGFRRQYAFTWP